MGSLFLKVEPQALGNAHYRAASVFPPSDRKVAEALAKNHYWSVDGFSEKSGIVDV